MSEQTESTPEKKPRVALWIATGLGLGYLPIAPGTWGSLGGVALAILIPAMVLIPVPFDQITSIKQFINLTVALQWGLAIAVSLIGVWASHKAERHFNQHDPGQVVVDEISGQMLTFLFAAPASGLVLFGFELVGPSPAALQRFVNWKYLLAGFILFRIFDIVKPWPIRRLEKLPGGWGIMADDWLAGIYAAVVLWIVRAAGWIG